MTTFADRAVSAAMVHGLVSGISSRFSDLANMESNQVLWLVSVSGLHFAVRIGSDVNA